MFIADVIEIKLLDLKVCNYHLAGRRHTISNETLAGLLFDESKKLTLICQLTILCCFYWLYSVQ